MLGANQRSTQVCTAVHTRQLLHCRAYLCQLLHWEVLTAGVASTGPALVFSIPQAFPWMVNLLFSSKATVPWSLRVVRVPHSSEAFILILTFKDLTWGATHLAAVRAQSSAQRVSLCKAIYLPSLLVLLERKTVKTCKRAYKAVPSCLSVQLPLFTFPLSDVTRLPPYSMSCVDDPSPGSLLAHFSPDAPPPPASKHAPHSLTQPPSSFPPGLPSPGSFAPVLSIVGQLLVLAGLQKGDQKLLPPASWGHQAPGKQTSCQAFSETRKEMGSINSQLPPQIGVQVGRWGN